MTKDRRKRQGGNAVLEFALTWAACSVMFTGIFQYGWSMFVYNSLQTAVTNAAEYGATANFSAADSSGFSTKVKNMAVYGNPSGGSTPLVYGLSASNINVDTNPQNGYPTRVTVSITGFAVNAVFGSQSFSGKPRVTLDYVGFTCQSGC